MTSPENIGERHSWVEIFLPRFLLVCPCVSLHLRLSWVGSQELAQNSGENNSLGPGDSALILAQVPLELTAQAILVCPELKSSRDVAEISA